MTAVSSWTVRQTGRAPRVAGPIEAPVPGTVQDALVAAGLLPPLEQGEAEREWQWVPRAGWRYDGALAVTAEHAAARRLRLVFGGLDTLASVRLGRRALGDADNAMRTWAFDVTGLRAGSHALSVSFEPLFAHLAARDAERRLPGWGVGVDKDHTGAWVRKPPVDFGWDFAPKVVPVGITGAVWLEATQVARIGRVHVEQRHGRSAVRVGVAVELDRVARGAVTLDVRLSLGGDPVAASAVGLGGRAATVELRVDDPRLWWPRGLGAQPLYDLAVVATDRGGAVLDVWRRRIGLRRLELRQKPDARGASFEFFANGRPFFARGANVVPAAGPVEDAAAAHMNLLRVWGGGPYASDAFYDRCDELGVLVWQDFPFACCTYPTFDRAFMANVKAEATEHVRRLQHRASLALWCGNNELENGLCGPRWTDARMAWSDYSRLFDRLLPAVVASEDGTRAWWPGSPHSPSGERMDFNSPASGDAHLWGVWHGGEPFESFTHSDHRFVSEFGFQSFSAPATFVRRLPAGERRIGAPAVAHRQRSGVGTARLLEYVEREHRWPPRFSDQLWLTQLVQAEGLLVGLEHWRRSTRCAGALLWQLNEPWAAPTWSTIDRDGRWKALHFALVRAFAPRAFSLERRGGTVVVHALDDRGDAPVVAEARLLATDGEEAGRWRFEARTGRRGRAAVGRIDFAAECDRAGLAPERALLAVELAIGGERLAGPQLARLVPWKDLDLRAPRLTLTELARGGGRVRVRLDCAAPAPWTWVEAGPRTKGHAPRATDDGLQFLHLVPGESRTLELATAAGTLRARCLQDFRR